MDSFQQVRTIGGKSVHTVQSHHHVLMPWEIIRRQLPAAPNLITLDHHKDSQPPFQEAVYQETKKLPEDLARDAKLRADAVASICFADGKSVAKAVVRLRHDEHVQAATLSGILNVAFVFSLDDSSGTESVQEAAHPYRVHRFQKNPAPPPPSPPFTYEMPEGRAFHVPYRCAVGCEKDCHDDDCNYSHSSQVLESSYLSERLGWAQQMASAVGIANIEGSPYILDIDLDFFHTTKALNPDDPRVFYRLIRNAQAVTIAVEAECARGCWLDLEPAPIDDMLRKIYGHIEAAMSEI